MGAGAHTIGLQQLSPLNTGCVRGWLLCGERCGSCSPTRQGLGLPW